MATRQSQVRAEKRLAEGSVRATPQRLRVLAELMDERDDATAQELHARLRARGQRIGLATVYRTLAVLVDEGIVDALSHHDGERCYRLCGAEHHHHLVCTECHRVVELTDCDIGEWLERAAREQGFVATEHRLEVSGLCEACR
jgi:Fur family transcriptional regulator, ferric uptake regulator